MTEWRFDWFNNNNFYISYPSHILIKNPLNWSQFDANSIIIIIITICVIDFCSIDHIAPYHGLNCRHCRAMSTYNIHNHSRKLSLVFLSTNVQNNNSSDCVHIANWSEIKPWHLFQPNWVSRFIAFMKSNLYFMAMIFLNLLCPLFGTRSDLQTQSQYIMPNKLNFIFNLHQDCNLYFAGKNWCPKTECAQSPDKLRLILNACPKYGSKLALSCLFSCEN